MGFLWVLGGIGKESMCIYIERELCGRLGLKVLRRRMKRRAEESCCSNLHVHLCCRRGAVWWSRERSKEKRREKCGGRERRKLSGPKAVVHYAGLWKFLKFNSRRWERWSLNLLKTVVDNADHCQPIPNALILA